MLPCLHGEIKIFSTDDHASVQLINVRIYLTIPYNKVDFISMVELAQMVGQNEASPKL